jgi:hydroxyacylglutathione hydrolase
MLMRQIVDEKLAQYAFLLGCQQSGEAMLVDPERDIDRYLDVAGREGLRIVAVAETHIHADFLSGARELAARNRRLRVYLSDEGGDGWRYEWPRQDGVDITWLHDGTTFRIGNIEVRAWHTPGHTPEHMSFVVTDRGSGASNPMGVLTGDFVFVGDLGRPDLLESAAGVQGAMEPSARRLYASTQRFLQLPDFLQIWPGHGAGSACGKALGAMPMTTVGYERRVSPAIAETVRGERAFVDFILADQPEPPLYFGEMKRLNKVGPPILRKVPAPQRLSPGELAAVIRESRVQIVDTREDRGAFFAAHAPGAFYAPVNRTFPTVIGSLLEADKPIVLLIAESHVDEAVRDLIRIGFDRITGWAPVPTLTELRAWGITPAAIETIDFVEFERRRSQGPVAVLDVRGAAEYRARHIPEARNIAHTRLRARLSDVPTDLPIYVHCRSGARAAVASAFLARHRGHVIDVDGDFVAWQRNSATPL